MNEILLSQEKKQAGFMMVQNQFLRDGVRKVGIGPAMLYLQLLSYCYGEKDIAYPSLKTLAQVMGTSVKTILVYRKILVEYGLIKKIIRRKDEKGNYQSTLYQLVLLNHPFTSQEKIDENEPVVSEIFDAGKDGFGEPDKMMEKSAVVKAGPSTCRQVEEDPLLGQLKALGVSENTAHSLLESYPAERVRKKLYLLREKRGLRFPGAYLFSVLKNNPSDHNLEEEITADEINHIQEEKRIDRRKYYKKMEESSIPRQESLKWIRKIKEQLKEGKIVCDLN